MRWVIAIGAIGLLSVVVLVAALNNGRSGGDKAELVGKLKSGLEDQGIPQSLTDCTVRRLRVSLDNKEIESLYDSQRGTNGGTSAVVESPTVKKAAMKSLIACGRRLLETGQLNRKELEEFSRGMSEPS